MWFHQHDRLSWRKPLSYRNQYTDLQSRANQWTGFYMITASALKELKLLLIASKTGLTGRPCHSQKLPQKNNFLTTKVQGTESMVQETYISFLFFRCCVSLKSILNIFLIVTLDQLGYYFMSFSWLEVCFCFEKDCHRWLHS